MTSRNRAATGRSRILHCEHGFHGLTYGALSLCGDAPFRERFGPFLGDCAAVPFDDLAALERALAPRDVAAFVVGEGITVGLLGAGLGLLLAYPFIEYGMGRWLEENMGAWFPYFRIPTEVSAMALGLGAALAASAAVIPAIRASRLDVIDALRRLG